MAKNVTATAKVRVTLEVPAGCSWSKDTSVSQVHEQAIEAALNRLGRMLDKDPGIEIVGAAKPCAILVERSED